MEKKKENKNEEKRTRPRVGIVSFERRKHPRFFLNLPVEYYRIDSPVSRSGRAVNASEGGLLVYLPEKLQIGQHVRVKLFLATGPALDTIEIGTQVVWTEIHFGKEGEDYRCGLSFVDISSEDLNKLKNFLKKLSE